MSSKSLEFGFAREGPDWVITVIPIVIVISFWGLKRSYILRSEYIQLSSLLVDRYRNFTGTLVNWKIHAVIQSAESIFQIMKWLLLVIPWPTHLLCSHNISTLLFSPSDRM